MSALCPPVFEPDLYPGLWQVDLERHLLSHEDVWVVSLTETSLQFIQLARREPGSVSLLLRILVVESEEVLVLDLTVLVVDVQPELVVVVARVLPVTDRVEVGWF